MTAPAAAPASAPIVLPVLRTAPQPAPDRFAFTAVLDSLHGAAGKAVSSAAKEGSRPSNDPQQGQQPSGQPNGHSTLGEGAFPSSLPFALPSALATDETAGAAVDAPASTKGARLETSGSSDAATVESPKPAVGRLTGERAFHFALSTSSGVGATLPPTAGPRLTDPPSFAPSPAASESESGMPGLSPLASFSTEDAGPTQEGPPSAVGAVLGSSEARPSAGAAAAMMKTTAPFAPRAAAASANPSVSQTRVTTEDPVRGGRTTGAAASPATVRGASPAAQAAKAEPGDKADGRPLDSAAPAGQSAQQGAAFGAPLSAPAAAGPSLGLYDAPAARADVAPRASAPGAAQASAAPPVREIDVDLAPGGLEDLSMTMRLAGDRLSVVIRAASSQSAGSIAGARDAIADRLAAIGQPLDSLIVRQTGANADANTNGNGADADEGSTSGGRQSEQGAGGQGGSSDASSYRRGAARDRSF